MQLAKNTAPYSEMAYFDGNACAHVAAYLEAKRLEWLRKRTQAAVQKLYNAR